MGWKLLVRGEKTSWSTFLFESHNTKTAIFCFNFKAQGGKEVEPVGGSFPTM